MKLYQIAYQGGAKGCPVYVKGTVNHDWEWEDGEPTPQNLTIENTYIFRAKHGYLNFDFNNEIFVSEDFLKLCSHYGMPYRSIPVTVIQSDGTEMSKKYVYCLAMDYRTIIDREKSTFTDHYNLETGTPTKDNRFPGVILVDEITHFVANENLVDGAHIFRCIDLNDHYVCSEEFMHAAIKSKLQGLSFTEINDQFKKRKLGDWGF